MQDHGGSRRVAGEGDSWTYGERDPANVGEAAFQDHSGVSQDHD
jgi:hypothetical protein